MNIEARIAPKKHRPLTPAELNPVYTPDQICKYPQPPIERYITPPLSPEFPFSQINGAQIIEDHGAVIGNIVRSALTTYNAMEAIKNDLSLNGDLTPEQILRYNGFLQAQRGNFSDLCNLVSDTIDVQSLVDGIHKRNIEEMEHHYELQ